MSCDSSTSDTCKKSGRFVFVYWFEWLLLLEFWGQMLSCWWSLCSYRAFSRLDDVCLQGLAVSERVVAGLQSEFERLFGEHSEQLVHFLGYSEVYWRIPLLHLFEGSHLLLSLHVGSTRDSAGC